MPRLTNKSPSNFNYRNTPAMEAGTIAPADPKFSTNPLAISHIPAMEAGTIAPADMAGHLNYSMMAGLQWRPGLLPRLTYRGLSPPGVADPCNGGRDYCPG